MARAALSTGRRIGQGPKPLAGYVPALTVALASLLAALPIVLQDERLSTAAVTRSMIEHYDMSRAKRAERVDAAAAAWILESALARLG